MNKIEALNILSLKDGATDEDIKKSFKSLAKEYHPDKNKDSGAEEKFKKISEAYEYLKSKKDESNSDLGGFEGGMEINFQNIQNFFRRNTQAWPSQPDVINTSIDITFAESVLGCARTIEVEKGDTCEKCSGSGYIPSAITCLHCNGNGYSQRTSRNGAAQYSVVSECNVCQKSGKVLEPCIICNKKGMLFAKSSLDIKIPGGIYNGQIVRLQNAGNRSRSGNFVIIGDILIKVVVEPSLDMRLVEKNVNSTIQISLLEALKGTKKLVNTVLGEAEIIIKENTRHKDNVQLNGYGVNKQNAHIFIIEVLYPEDTSKLIQVLGE